MAAKVKFEVGGDNGGDVEANLPPSATASPAAGVGTKVIQLSELDTDVINITLIGMSSLICHKWSEKSKRQMLDKQMGMPSMGRENKDPRSDYEASLYVDEEGRYVFPAIAFKGAAVSACTSVGKSVTKVQARQAFHILGDWVEIIGEPSMREDMVRVGQGTADIRYRAEFKKWSASVDVWYNKRVLSAAQVINLFNISGFAVGVGEWRPERDGMHGMYRVKGTPIKGLPSNYPGATDDDTSTSSSTQG